MAAFYVLERVCFEKSFKSFYVFLRRFDYSLASLSNRLNLIKLEVPVKAPSNCAYNTLMTPNVDGSTVMMGNS